MLLGSAVLGFKAGSGTPKFTFLISLCCLSQVVIGSEFNQDVEQCLSDNQNLTDVFLVGFLHII